MNSTGLELCQCRAFVQMSWKHIIVLGKGGAATKSEDARTAMSWACEMTRKKTA